MPLVPTLITFTAGTDILASEANSNFTALRDTINEYAALIDQANTFAEEQTFDGGLVSAGATLSAPLTSSSVLTASVTGATPYVFDFNSATIITVANGAVIDLSTDIANGVEFVVIDVTSTRAAKFFAGFNGVDMLTADTASFSTTSGTASRTNVYCDTGAGNRIRLQNNTGGSRFYRVTAIRY